MSYRNAEEALSALSCSKPLGRNLAIVAALELRLIAAPPGAARDVREAYAAVQCVAAGGELVMDLTDRRRLAQAADMLRMARERREELLLLNVPEDVNRADEAVRYG
jgi:hypothetical protein